MKLEDLSSSLQETFNAAIQSSEISVGELSIEVSATDLLSICETLRESEKFKFEMLIDLCGVDYLEYGVSEWTTSKATLTGFSRGVDKTETGIWTKPRFAVVYHLLSITHNHRLRIKTFANTDPPIVPSVINIWNSANWYEREAFDLYGILFEGHPDLRRLLTDYGFIGHPFRKDFPLIGTVEMRYSAKDKRVIYEPVSIEPRTLVPKTIPVDHRYLSED